MVVAMGDAWVMTSFCPFHASLPSDLWKASRHWSGALPWTKIRSPSINGDAALCHAITVLPYSVTRSLLQTTAPLVVLRQ